MDAITNVLKDWDKEVLQDSSLVYDSKKLVNQLNNVIPVFGEYGLKYNTDALDSSSDWSLLNDNSIYVFKDLGKNAPALGNNKKGILIVVGEKSNEAQFVFTPHQMMYKTEGAWQKLLNTDDLQNIVNNYVKTSDTTNWQKQKIFADNSYRLTRCPKGTDFGLFLQSSSVPVGFSIVRDGNTNCNFMVIKETSSWVYSLAISGTTNGVGLIVYRVINGKPDTYRSFSDIDSIAAAGFLYNADGSLKWNMWSADGKDFSKEVYNYIQARKKATVFYVQGGTTGLPTKESARGLILPSNDGLGDVILMGNDGELYVGWTADQTMVWHRFPNTDELEQHSLEKWNYSHRLYIGSGQDTLAALSNEVKKGQGSFTFFCSTGATNLPFKDPLSLKIPWRGLFMGDGSNAGGQILFFSPGGALGVASIDTKTHKWYNPKLISQRSQLSSTDDLNSIMTTGDYTFGAKPKNAPDGVEAWSYMHVISTTDLEDRNTSMVLQMVFRNSNNVGNTNGETSYLGYTRTWSGIPSSWSPWVPFGQTDSGWVDVISVDPSKWVSYTNWNTSPSNIVARARKNNHVVAIDTWFTNRVAMQLNVFDEITIAQLPSGFAPTRDQRQVMQGSSNNTWLLLIKHTGEVKMARYSQDGVVDAGRWLSGTMTYMAD